MTAYNFQGYLVDVKAYNWHMSAPVDASPGNSHATTDGITIDAGAIVADGTSGTIINGTAATAAKALGVANKTMSYAAGDLRQLTYTWAGVVRVKTSGLVTAFDRIMATNAGEVVSATNTILTAHHNQTFGKALETATDDIIMAYVNFSH